MMHGIDKNINTNCNEYCCSRGCWLWINAKTLEGALDPLFLALSMAVSLAALGAGIYTIIRSKSFDFSVSNWNDFTQVRGRGWLA